MRVMFLIWRNATAPSLGKFRMQRPNVRCGHAEREWECWSAFCLLWSAWKWMTSGVDSIFTPWLFGDGELFHDTCVRLVGSVANGCQKDHVLGTMLVCMVHYVVFACCHVLSEGEAVCFDCKRANVDTVLICDWEFEMRSAGHFVLLQNAGSQIIIGTVRNGSHWGFLRVNENRSHAHFAHLVPTCSRLQRFSTVIRKVPYIYAKRTSMWYICIQPLSKESLQHRSRDLLVQCSVLPERNRFGEQMEIIIIMVLLDDVLNWITIRNSSILVYCIVYTVSNINIRSPGVIIVYQYF